MKPIKILIVEDDEHFYNLMTILFSKISKQSENDYALTWQGNSYFDINIFNDFHAILLDYSLETCTGLDILDKAAGSGCKTPIIFLTGQKGREVFREAQKKGAAGYLVKQEITKAPFALESVIGFAMENAAQKIRLQHMALYDQLTGLPNRSLFFDRLGNAIAGADRNALKAALLYIDLDGFKAVNDTSGHESGDMVLKETALRLKTAVRSMDTVARLGGDEFAVILQVKEKKEAGMVAEKIIQKVSEPIITTDTSFTVGASIGISIYPDDTKHSATLIHNADAAMYKVKEQGKNQTLFWCGE